MNDDKRNATGPKTYSDKLWQVGAKHSGDSWYMQHLDALQNPRVGFEAAIVAILQGWLLYADSSAHRFGSGIGKDYVLSEHWAAIGHGLRGLLNGETGRLDCGLVDSILDKTLSAEGCQEA